MSKPLTLTEYQKKARSTAIYPDIGENIYYPTLGLAGEVGEVCNKIKKIQRDKGGQWSEEDRQTIKKEIGDCMWYVASVCSEFQLDLGEVAQANLDKLASRKERGVLQGSGDNR
jgi:NTP pyrophosphatase (non-canonical NTP hydrolase)